MGRHERWKHQRNIITANQWRLQDDPRCLWGGLERLSLWGTLVGGGVVTMVVVTTWIYATGVSVIGALAMAAFALMWVLMGLGPVAVTGSETLVRQWALRLVRSYGLQTIWWDWQDDTDAPLRHAATVDLSETLTCDQYGFTDLRTLTECAGW